MINNLNMFGILPKEYGGYMDCVDSMPNFAVISMVIFLAAAGLLISGILNRKQRNGKLSIVLSGLILVLSVVSFVLSLKFN